ncbi:hypothetical protein [Rhodococcus sp. SJ-3]|uniref:hypothetical protein n=1 Tax=Rhodococcus sp. SJ-3 TaxID=3454628 RepID=UPI003F79C324
MTIRHDLTVGDVEAAAVRGHSGGTAGPWVWVVHHASDDPNIEPNPLSDWYCLLSILDRVSFALQCRLAVRSPYPEVSYDGGGLIWIVAGEVWVVDPRSPGPVQHLPTDRLAGK